MSAYSPAYSPAETVVKERIRHAELNSTTPALQLLVESLNHYSVGGAGGQTARNHFNIFEQNHAMFLQHV